jgi:hypothetical protein
VNSSIEGLLKPDAPAKECRGIPSLALQASFTKDFAQRKKSEPRYVLQEEIVDDVETLVQEVNRSRMYTNLLLDSIAEADWFRQSADRISHVAWQVGHLAVGQYRMALLVIRGPQPSDEQLISEAFVQRFQPGSVPDPDLEQHFSAQEIREVFQRVHAQTIAELQQLTPASLHESVSPAHPMFSTRGGAIRWSTHHEYTHAGQISLLRRLLGYQPLW